MAVPVDEQSVKRLAYIRMLYEQGVAQAKQPMPMGASSLLSLHDAVEMFLVLASDALSIPGDQRTDFLGYWKKLKEVALSQSLGMRRLNDARNGLKHAGAIPSAEAVDQALTDTFAFFDDNVPRVFGVALWSVDVSYVIPQQTVREWTQKASANFEEGKGGAALALLQLALQHVLGDQRWPHGTVLAGLSQRSRSRPGKLALLFQMAFGESHSHRVGEVTRGMEELEKTVAGLREALQWTVLGGSLHHYARFQSLTPNAGFYWSRDESRLEEYLASERVTQRKPTREEFEFCRQFVVTTALRQADVSAHVALPSWEAERRSSGDSGA
ncbi:hypothetical protein [Streptomyces sp. NPDC056169]|uniref:hypothetical protein n=1 Tax=Streptomyces sp. NPDC056169 TaxID=3345734 RepID=UPI0035E3383F